MTDRGRVFDTYVAALQHDQADLPEAAIRLGVVRRPTPWLYGVVDENEPALGPPADLLDEVKSRHEELVSRGYGDAEAHNAAMDAVEYAERYRHHLESDGAAMEALDRLRARLADGEDVALVCFENTDEKRCHRTILRSYL